MVSKPHTDCVHLGESDARGFVVCFFPVRIMPLGCQTIYAKRQEYSAPGREIFPWAVS